MIRLSTGVLQRERERGGEGGGEKEGGERERERVCVCVCVSSVIRCNKNPVHLRWLCRRGQTKQEGKKMQYSDGRTSPW
jgi:hypothetical protein